VLEIGGWWIDLVRAVIEIGKTLKETTMKSIKHIMALALILGVTATPCFAQTGEHKLNIDERMIHRRAIEVGYKVIW